MVEVAVKGAWVCQAQEPQELQAYEQRENVIGLSDISDEPFRRQAVQPQSSNSNHLWQSHQPLVEGAVTGYYLTSRVLQRLLFRRDAVTSFEELSSDLHRCLAYAARRCPTSYQGSADSSLGRYVVRCCFAVPLATSGPRLDRYQTIEAQPAANLLGGHDNAGAARLLREQVEWAR